MKIQKIFDDIGEKLKKLHKIETRKRTASVASCNLLSTPHRKSTRVSDHNEELTSSQTIGEEESPKAHVSIFYSNISFYVCNMANI